MNREERDRRDHRIGQYVAEHDRAIAQPQSAGSADIIKIARAQELGAHDMDEAHQVTSNSTPISVKKPGCSRLDMMMSR